MSGYFFMPSGVGYARDVTLQLRDRHGVSPVIWMGDEVHDRFARETFPECEVLDWDSQLNGGDSREMSNQSFLKLSQYWNSSTFESQREGLLEELNRYHSPDRVRNLDREVLLRRLQSSIFEKLLERRPSFFVASETPHNHVFLAALYLVQWLEIPTLFFQPTTTLAPALLPKTGLNEVFQGQKVENLAPESPSRALIAETSGSLLNQLSAGKYTLRQRYERTKLAEQKGLHVSAARRSWRKFKGFVRSLDFQLTWGMDSLGRAEKGLSMLLEYHRSRLDNEHKLLPSSPSAGTYAFFAMHFQPERTSVPEGGLKSFQFENFVRARELLPSDLTLVIKEHESQVSGIKPGHHGRPFGFYNLLKSLPNTEVVSAWAKTNELMENSAVVFTLTGSIGIEAALRGIPVVYFGNPWWAGTPGTYAYHDLKKNDSIESLKPARNNSVRNYLLTVVNEKAIVGLATPSGEEFWKRYWDLPPEFYSDAIDQFVETTRLFISEKVSKSTTK